MATHESSPEAVAPIPASLQYLVTDFGKYVGFEDFAFDAENLIFLVLEEKDLLIEYVNEDAGLLLQTELTTLSAPLDAAGLNALLLLNANGFRAGIGTLGLDPEKGTLYWMDRIPLPGLTVETLDAALGAFPEKVKVWQEMISDVLLPLAEKQPEDTAASPEENKTFIAV